LILIQSKTAAVAALAAVIAAFPLLLIVLVTASPGSPAQAAGSAAGLAGEPAGLARADIPADYLTWYTGAAQTCQGLPWAVLAGIGKVESDHGQSGLPGVHSGANAAGAEGPMQFLPATFGEFAVDADPGLPVSPYDPADAIYTAARMLCADGARGGSTAGIDRAVFAYNHADWYVREVLSWAARYAAPAATAPAGPAAQPSPQTTHARTPAREDPS
jgi:soluble lytic murein transglycosylase-like protein